MQKIIPADTECAKRCCGLCECPEECVDGFRVRIAAEGGDWNTCVIHYDEKDPFCDHFIGADPAYGHWSEIQWNGGRHWGKDCVDGDDWGWFHIFIDLWCVSVFDEDDYWRYRISHALGKECVGGVLTSFGQRTYVFDLDQGCDADGLPREGAIDWKIPDGWLPSWGPDDVQFIIEKDDNPLP